MMIDVVTEKKKEKKNDVVLTFPSLHFCKRLRLIAFETRGEVQMEMANESDDENVELISRKQVAQRLDVQQRANSVGLKTQTVSAPLVENSSLSRRAAIGLLLVLASVLLVTIFSQLHEASSPASHSSKPVIDSSSNSHSVATNADYLKTSGDIILKSLKFILIHRTHEFLI